MCGWKLLVKWAGNVFFARMHNLQFMGIVGSRLDTPDQTLELVLNQSQWRSQKALKLHRQMDNGLFDGFGVYTYEPNSVYERYEGSWKKDKQERQA